MGGGVSVRCQGRVTPACHMSRRKGSHRAAVTRLTRAGAAERPPLALVSHRDFVPAGRGRSRDFLPSRQKTCSGPSANGERPSWEVGREGSWPTAELPLGTRWTVPASAGWQALSGCSAVGWRMDLGLGWPGSSGGGSAWLGSAQPVPIWRARVRPGAQTRSGGSSTTGPPNLCTVPGWSRSTRAASGRGYGLPVTGRNVGPVRSEQRESVSAEPVTGNR